MTFKDIMIDFLNFAFAIILIIACILYFAAGNSIATFTAIIEAITPLVLFIALLSIKIKFSRHEYKQRKQEQNTEINLRLSNIQKIFSDIIVFSLPVIICLIAFIINQKIEFEDILQALIIFFIAYFWQYSIFKKENN